MEIELTPAARPTDEQRLAAKAQAASYWQLVSALRDLLGPTFPSEPLLDYVEAMPHVERLALLRSLEQRRAAVVALKLL